MYSYELGTHKKWADIPLSIKLLPIVIFETYLCLTVLLFAFGPWPWPVSNTLQLYTFILAAHIALAVGYLTGMNGKCSKAGSDKTNLKILVRYSIIISIILYFPTVYSRTGSIYPEVFNGIKAIGEAYRHAVEISFSGGKFIYVEYTRVLVAPITALAIPIIIINWHLWPKIYRISALLLVLANVAMYLAMGTNLGVADTALTLPWLIMLGYFSRGIRITKIGWIWIISIVTVAFIGATLFFVIGLTQRYGAGTISGSFGYPLNIHTDRNQPYYALLPKQLALLYESISRYVCQGYYALSLALKMSFHSTYGLGNSMFLYREATNWFGLGSIVNQSYPSRLGSQYGWGMYRLWDTAYVWIASDVGFIGCLFVIFFIGRWLCSSWKDTLTVRDPRAAVVFYFLLIIIFYLPANNQIAQDGETFVAFYVVLIWWLVCRNGLVFKKY